MKIAFVGYMTSGKTHWARQLSEELECEFIDLDSYLANQVLNTSIYSFITEKGELAFRKAERKALEDVLKLNNVVIATGGGTPCYYDNMDVLNANTTTIYLDVSLQTLVNRLLKERNTRPLVAHLKDTDVKEFVAKHLFERKPYYYQAKHILAESQISMKQLLHIIKKEDA